MLTTCAEDVLSRSEAEDCGHHLAAVTNCSLCAQVLQQSSHKTPCCRFVLQAEVSSVSAHLRTMASSLPVSPPSLLAHDSSPSDLLCKQYCHEGAAAQLQPVHTDYFSWFPPYTCTESAGVARLPKKIWYSEETQDSASLILGSHRLLHLPHAACCSSSHQLDTQYHYLRLHCMQMHFNLWLWALKMWCTAASCRTAT